ncbi:hypothetical protein [Altericroceibacterium endophyticum]|uniref:Uncharacterized protein n=1 Tax=Altericroceibacterium endophyticum TaxID=1808508 RepID=A0A6I4T6X2_9SPHN|nr:hypothetical protein [Altericroceibacterium endophyticum]MXO66229.1 hypothetical protein [Altericroceibacterium endophyticum]
MATLTSFWFALTSFIWAAAPVAVAYSAMRIAGAQYAGSAPVALIRESKRSFERIKDGSIANTNSIYAVHFWNHRKYAVEFSTLTVRANIPIRGGSSQDDKLVSVNWLGSTYIACFDEIIEAGSDDSFLVSIKPENAGEQLKYVDLSLLYLDPRSGKHKRLWLQPLDSQRPPWIFHLNNQLRLSRVGWISQFFHRWGG